MEHVRFFIVYFDRSHPAFLLDAYGFVAQEAISFAGFTVSNQTFGRFAAIGARRQS